MKFFVSRQNYWPDGRKMVEVCQGGLDYANPDMLVPLWPELGEGKEFTNPLEAVESAINICEAWKKLSPDVGIGMGATLGFSEPFDESSYEALRARAEKIYENLPKCVGCGELLGKESYTHYRVTDDEQFCSERCAEEDLSLYNHSYDNSEQCKENGDHLLSVDSDGYCNACGEQ